MLEFITLTSIYYGLIAAGLAVGYCLIEYLIKFIKLLFKPCIMGWKCLNTMEYDNDDDKVCCNLC